MASAYARTVVIWDVGGVLLHWNADEVVANYKGGRYVEECKIIFNADWKRFDRGDYSFSDMRRIKAEQTGLIEEEVAAIMRAAFQSLAPKHDVIEVFHSLRERGVRQFCLTNGSREYWAHVNGLDGAEYRDAYEGFSLADLFSDEQVVLSAPLNIAKPEREIYAHAAEKFGLTSEDRVIFIDDSEVNCAGARACGWDALHFTGDVGDIYKQLPELLLPFGFAPS